MQDSPWSPADRTNRDSIPASLGDACNKTLRGWSDKWVSKVEEQQQQAQHQEWLWGFLAIHIFIYIYIESITFLLECPNRGLIYSIIIINFYHREVFWKKVTKIFPNERTANKNHKLQSNNNIIKHKQRDQKNIKIQEERIKWRIYKMARERQ